MVEVKILFIVVKNFSLDTLPAREDVTGIVW